MHNKSVNFVGTVGTVGTVGQAQPDVAQPDVASRTSVGQAQPDVKHRLLRTAMPLLRTAMPFVRRCCTYGGNKPSTESVGQAQPDVAQPDVKHRLLRTAMPFKRTAMPYLLLSLATIAPMSAHAWGFKGHTYIGDVAWEYLSPEAKAWVTDKLQRVDEQSLGEMVTWADRIRSTPEGRNMGPLHYANVPPTETEFILQRDCEAMRCVVGAAIQASEIMLASDSSPREQAV